MAVISYRFWREHFAGADDAIGRQITLQRRTFTVVGVMPPGFFGTDVGRMTDVMLPFAAEPLMRGEESQLADVGSSWLNMIVRRKPGQSLEQANAALRGVQPQIRTATMSGISASKSRALSRPSIDPGRRCDRQVVAPRNVRDAAHRDDRGRWTPAAGRLHEHRQPAGRARSGPAPRAQREDGAWRFAGRLARLLFTESLIVAMAGAALA